MMENYKSNRIVSWFLKKNVLILLLLLHLPIGIIHASYMTLGNNLRNFTSQDGLADNMILCIHKDQKGFMWFGTNYGLSKYDGKNFYNYALLDDSNVAVSKIEENSEGLLFLLSNDWLTLFDCKKERVQILPVVLKEQYSQFLDFTLINDSVVLACDKQMFLRINVLERDRNPNIKIAGVYNFPLKEGEIFVRFCLISDKNDFYAVTNFGRVLLIDKNTMRIKKIVQFQTENKEIGISSISYHNGNIWISSMIYGICIYDLSLERLDRLVNDNTQTVLSHNDVYSISCLSESLYVATTWFGYTMVHRDTHTGNVWTSRISQQVSCDVNRTIETRMISSYYDPIGIFWIGTHGGGVIMIDLRWNFYKRYEQGIDNETESIVTDTKGRIYLSTYHLGIMRTVKPFHDTRSELEFNPISIPDTSPTFLCSVKDKRGKLWFGNKDGKIVCYDDSLESYKVYDTLSHLNVSINSLFIDDKYRFWVGTSKGLLLLNKNLSVRQHFLLKNQTPPIFDIKKDKEHNYWIATGIGVFKLNEKEGDWSIIDCEIIQKVNTAQCILIASDNNVYVGFKNGLGVIGSKENRFSRVLTTADGLMSNWINCIIEGKDGDIWIGSNSGITRYDQKSKCYNYYISESNKSATFVGDVLFWGGSKHLSYFDSKEAILAFESNYNNKVFITNLEVNGKRVNTGEKYDNQIILNQQIAYTEEISLNYTNRNITLSFSNCSYSYGMQKYEYRLYPYQKEWITSNDNEAVSYANLFPGEYTFQVRAIYPGNLNGAVTDLKINILPHWSQTWIFRTMLLLLFISFIIFLLHKNRKRQLRREQILCLEHDLNMANMLKEQEIHMKEEREQFFVQVAHELRTPLTLILAPLSELLISTDKTNVCYTKLLYIRKSAKSMQNLVNQLLHIQKMKVGVAKLCVHKTSIRDVVEQTAFLFKEFAVRQEVEFIVTIDYDVEVYIDVDKMKSSIENLLSNSFKYTPSGGKVFLNVFSELQDDDRYCCVQVKDTGAGIALKQQSYIFNSFTTTDNIPNYSTAMGIGLYIVKSTLELHHGFVKLESENGKGSSFTLFIPEGKEHFTNDNCNMSESVINVEEDNVEAIASGEMQITPTTVRRLNGWSILIVEDNFDVRNYIVSLFNDEYKVYEACNGEEGMHKAEHFLPDLIISDVMMPIKDGFEFCRELRSNTSTFHIPVIMLTAKVEDMDIIKATHLGIDDYLTKPFNAGVLKAKVKNLLLQRKLLKEFYSKSLNLKLSDNSQETTGEEAFMQQVIYIIEANLANEEFNAKMLCSLLNMSQPTLYRKIKNICQLSIIEVIRNVKMSKAASLLLLRKYSVQDVCEMVGYNDYDTFRKHFVAQFKVSPSKYESTVEKE